LSDGYSHCHDVAIEVACDIKSALGPFPGRMEFVTQKDEDIAFIFEIRRGDVGITEVDRAQFAARMSLTLRETNFLICAGILTNLQLAISFHDEHGQSSIEISDIKDSSNFDVKLGAVRSFWRVFVQGLHRYNIQLELKGRFPTLLWR
jgi:hypothetical protein